MPQPRWCSFTCLWRGCTIYSNEQFLQCFAAWPWLRPSSRTFGEVWPWPIGFKFNNQRRRRCCIIKLPAQERVSEKRPPNHSRLLEDISAWQPGKQTSAGTVLLGCSTLSSVSYWQIKSPWCQKASDDNVVSSSTSVLSSRKRFPD